MKEEQYEKRYKFVRSIELKHSRRDTVPFYLERDQRPGGGLQLVNSVGEPG